MIQDSADLIAVVLKGFITDAGEWKVPREPQIHSAV